MAIKDFGESLLADVRKRKEEQRKRDEGGTLGKFTRGLETIKGVAEIGQSLGFFGGTQSDQINAFAQNKDVLDTNIRISQAENYVNQYDELKENVNAFNGTNLEYFVNKSLDETVNRELEKPSNIKRVTGTEDARTNFITSYKSNLRATKKIQDMAAKALKDYEDFGKVREEFRNTGTTEKAVEMAQAKLPSTLKALTNIFTGTEATEEAVNNYTSSLRSQGASKVLMFKEIFKESGGDFTSAVEIADGIGLGKKVDESLTNRKTQTEVTGTDVIIYEQETDGFGNKTIVEGSVKVQSVLSQQAQVAQRLADYNPMEAAQSSLNQKGIAALKEAGFVFGLPKDTEAYENQVDILNKVLNETDKNGNNIYMVPVLSDIEKARRLTESQIKSNISGTTAYKEASRALINANLASKDLKEKIVADPANSGLSEKEIDVKLNENDEYKRLSKQAAISQSIINGLLEQGEDLLNDKFPESVVVNEDDAETASKPVETSTNETEGEVIVTADQVAEAVANQSTRTLLGVPVARGTKSLQSIRKQLEQVDFKLTEDDLPSQKRKSLLEKREEIQEDFDRYEKAELIKNPDYSKTPSKAYALRMLKEDRRTLSEEDAIANYVKRMKGEMK